MFRFIVALLVINCYSGSWGAPTQNVTMLISVSLNELANNCESPFLSSQMKSRIKDCDVPVPPYQAKQYECLLFYDINRQLCGAVATAKLALKGDYTSQILAVQDVSQLCNSAKEWTFTDMGALYNKTVNSVFHDPLRCFKFCIDTSDSILSVDSNYYCKYFKWGSEMLKSAISVKQTQDNAGVAQITSDNVSAKNDVSAVGEKDEAEIEKPIQSNEVVQPKQPSTTDSKTAINITSTNNINQEMIPTDIKVEESAPSGSQQELPGTNVDNKKPLVKEHIPAVIPPAFTNEEQQPVAPKDIMPKDLTTSTVSQKGNNNDKKEDSDSEVKNGANQDIVLNSVDNQKPANNADLDDYQQNDPDSDEMRDGLGDTQGGDDSDDPLETKLVDEISKKTIGIHEPPVYNNDIPPKESYSNTIPDFAEEDDHFFPFFLTAIIMVVLLYILYHNKNKVSKVVLGLIVEGRQPGRRRNSRGHAYRRLDTLEQAMSTNTAAPPSKIIY